MIPKLHYISQGNTLKEHLENIQKACASGAELVQLRIKNTSEKKVLKAAQQAREITSHFQTRLIINKHYKIAKEIKADGVHLGQSDSCPALARKYLYPWQIIGGTANTLDECEALLDKQVNYISLGPFKTSKTEENTTNILGLQGFTAITDILKTGTPILGVGGITTKDVVDILETGIAGLGVSEAITRDFNTIRVFHALLKASSTAEQRYTFE